MVHFEPEFFFSHIYMSLLKYYFTKHYLDIQLKSKKRSISEFVFVSPKRKNNLPLTLPKIHP